MTARLALGRYPHGGAEAVLADLADACIDGLLAGPAVRDEAAFEAAVARITLELPKRYAAALAQMVACLVSAWEADRAADELTSPVVAESVADVRAELGRLLGTGAASRIGEARLPDLRRYLQALAWRTTRIADDPGGDLRRLDQAREAESLLAAAVPGWPVTDPMAVGPMPRTARQLADEFRVSLFAPHIRTAMPVSARRIEKFLAGAPAGGRG